MKRKKKKSIIIFLIMLISVFIVTFYYMFDKSFTYQLERYSKKEVVNTINREINKVIVMEIENSNLSYNDIISLEKGVDGNISCVKADMILVNKLKNNLDIKIADICECEDSFEANIPVGNLMGGSLFYGKGFLISVKFKPIGEAYSQMTGKLEETGINQTIYRISFDVNVNAAVVFPFRYIEVPIKIETIIAETVIVGNVPEAYTYFYTAEEISNGDLQGFVEDFKAE